MLAVFKKVLILSILSNRPSLLILLQTCTFLRHRISEKAYPSRETGGLGRRKVVGDEELNKQTKTKRNIFQAKAPQIKPKAKGAAYIKYQYFRRDKHLDKDLSKNLFARIYHICSHEDNFKALVVNFFFFFIHFS